MINPTMIIGEKNNEIKERDNIIKEKNEIIENLSKRNIKLNIE